MMEFAIAVPSEQDVPVVSDIHLRAMDSNALLHAQFPDQASLAYLRGWLGRNTGQHIREEDKGVFVAKCAASGETAGFVKWLVHRRDAEEEEENWPETCRKEYLDSYAELTGRARRHVTGTRPYYHITFLCTDPKWARRGVASSMLRRVQEAAAVDDMDIVLESTMESVSFYEKLGFKALEGLHLMLPAPGSEDPTERYEEKCMVWRKAEL